MVRKIMLLALVAIGWATASETPDGTANAGTRTLEVVKQAVGQVVAIPGAALYLVYNEYGKLRSTHSFFSASIAQWELDCCRS